MKGNGMKRQAREMEWVFKYGLMVQCMKGFGKMIRQTEKEDLFMQIEMSMKVIG